MALSRVTTWAASQVLTASALNGEFDNVLNNALSLISPLTGDLDFNGNDLINLSAGTVGAPSISFNSDSDTGLYRAGANIFAVASGGVDVARFQTIASGVNYLDLTPAATGNRPVLAVAGSDSNIGLSVNTKGTKGVLFNGIAFGGAIWGLTLSNNSGDATNDIDIAVGEAISGDAASVDKVGMALTSAITKQLDAAWAVGTNAGGLDTGSIANTTYHVWLIKRTDTGVVDALFSTSATAPTMPTNYDKKRRIGSIVRTGAAIKAFVQDGDLFQWKASVLDVDANNPGTSAVTRTLTVPLGINARAMVNCLITTTLGTTGVYLSDLDVTDEAVSDSAAPLSGIGAQGGSTENTPSTGPIFIRTNTSAQIRSRLLSSDASTTLRIATLGWLDTRGRHN